MILGDILLSLFRMFWLCFGTLILITFAIGFFFGRPPDFAMVVRPFLAAVIAGFKLIAECCAAVAEHVSAKVPEPFSGLVGFVLQMLFLGIFVAVVVWLTVHP